MDPSRFQRTCPISFTHAVAGPLKEAYDGTVLTADRSCADRDTSSRKDVPMKRPPSTKKALPALILPALLALLLAPAIAAATPAVHVVTHITPKPATPNVLRPGQSVSLSLSYVSPEPTGVRILVQPMTGGKPASGWVSSSSPVEPAGSGTATRSFKITRGDVTVNRIRIQIWNAAETVKLQQVVIPVHYRFTKAKANVVHGLTMTPESTAITSLSTFTCPVSISRVTSANWAAKGGGDTGDECDGCHGRCRGDSVGGSRAGGVEKHDCCGQWQRGR